MRIEAYGQSALICATGVSDTPNEDGKFTAEFYPVDLLLDLRRGGQILEGHPFFDLRTVADDDQPTIVVEHLRKGQIKKIIRELGRGKFVALKIKRSRPPKSGQGRQWRRAQAGQPRMDRRQQAGFFFVRGQDYLSDEDIHWIDAVCENGRLYYERLQAIQAIGEFAEALGRAFIRSQPREKAKMKLKAKMKRKERREMQTALIL